MSHDPDYWAFSNEDGKLERCDMRQFKADLDAAINYQKECEAMLDNFIIIKGDDSGNVTLRLSNYAAWALLRRLKGEDAADDTEASLVPFGGNIKAEAARVVVVIEDALQLAEGETAAREPLTCITCGSCIQVSVE